MNNSLTDSISLLLPVPVVEVIDESDSLNNFTLLSRSVSTLALLNKASALTKHAPVIRFPISSARTIASSFLLCDTYHLAISSFLISMVVLLRKRVKA